MDDPATLVIGQRVHEGLDEEYTQWHQRVSAAAAQCPGYVEIILREPNTTENQWVTVVRFDSVANLRNWVNSSTRQRFLDEGQHIFEGPNKRMNHISAEVGFLHPPMEAFIDAAIAFSDAVH